MERERGPTRLTLNLFHISCSEPSNERLVAPELHSQLGSQIVAVRNTYVKRPKMDEINRAVNAWQCARWWM